MARILKENIMGISNPAQLSLLRTVTQYNVEPMHTPENWKHPVDLLGKYPCLWEPKLPTGIMDVLEDELYRGWVAKQEPPAQTAEKFQKEDYQDLIKALGPREIRI